jgi:hypothetical protein
LNRNHWILEDHEIHNESYNKIPPIYIILGGIYRFVYLLDHEGIG